MRGSLLLYHWFRSVSGDAGRSPEFAMCPEAFRDQMRTLASGPDPVVSLAAFVAALGGQTTLAPGSVVVTFDDAYDDFRDHALPILAELKLPAVQFAVAGLVGRSNEWDQRSGEPSRPLMDWPGLRELAAAGVEIGSHSLTHPDLTTLSEPEIREECRASRARLEDGLGRKVRYFAYPFGSYDGRVKRAVREAGYEAACAVLLRPWDMLRSDRFSIMRVIIHANRGVASFRRRTRLAAPFHRVG